MGWEYRSVVQHLSGRSKALVQFPSPKSKPRTYLLLYEVTPPTCLTQTLSFSSLSKFYLSNSKHVGYNSSHATVLRN